MMMFNAALLLRSQRVMQKARRGSRPGFLYNFFQTTLFDMSPETKSSEVLGLLRLLQRS